MKDLHDVPHVKLIFQHFTTAFIDFNMQYAFGYNENDCDT